ELIVDVFAVKDLIYVCHIDKRAIRTAKAGESQSTRFLLNGHLRNQILCALLDGQTPILIEVQLTVLIEVLEVQTVDDNEQILVFSAQSLLRWGSLDVIEA